MKAQLVTSRLFTRDGVTVSLLNISEMSASWNDDVACSLAGPVGYGSTGSTGRTGSTGCY